MKAAPEAQKRLLDLAELDAALARLAHRRSSLPEIAELDELGGRMAGLGSQIVAAETAVSDLAREQTKAETDVDQVRARADRDQKRLDSGQVSSPRDLENLQHEIASLQRRQGDLEEVVLEIMERREAAEAKVAELTAQRAELETRRDELTAARDAAFSEIDKEAFATGERRKLVAGQIPDDLLALYEKLRGQYGVGAALLQGGRCGGCKLSLNVSDLNRIRSAPHDEVVRCEECRRILVRTAESGL
ncbi:zinc ribbon domain-containing protein [Bailinhaonella thermotolerans]|uniref:Uncharacterized protein n=1 Tax=Bailinhaonella thermotolerans TaxID=1070861 RepID=A0A3A4B7S4_9ACTN|nr:C4-type zinc ribbon domain-containing protein [Bailinhaonella thermotolerans]RJL34281.1 hypothetical protein D5H75_07430 [Bailinhaonella thermotolerans]